MDVSLYIYITDLNIAAAIEENDIFNEFDVIDDNTCFRNANDMELVFQYPNQSGTVFFSIDDKIKGTINNVVNVYEKFSSVRVFLHEFDLPAILLFDGPTTLTSVGDPNATLILDVPGKAAEGVDPNTILIIDVPGTAAEGVDPNTTLILNGPDTLTAGGDPNATLILDGPETVTAGAVMTQNCNKLGHDINPKKEPDTDPETDPEPDSDPDPDNKNKTSNDKTRYTILISSVCVFMMLLGIIIYVIYTHNKKTEILKLKL